MTTTQKHTPTPWEAGPLDSGGVPVYSGPRNQDEVVCQVLDMSDNDVEVNAAFIVLAVNSHERLLEVLNQLVHDVEGFFDPHEPTDVIAEDLADARAAIAAAEGRTE